MQPAPAPTRPRKRWFAIAAALMMFLLAGCGGTVDTVLTIDASGKGVRTMTVQAKKSDIKEYVPKGVPAIEASLKKHLPAELKYTGVKAVGEQQVFTFVLEFSSIEDYSAKVGKLVSLGTGSPFAPEIKFEAPTSLFRNGLSLRENFTSAQLMAWAKNGLADDKVFKDTSNADSFSIDNGTSVVKFDKQTYEAYSTISVDKIVDNGISSAAMQTTLKPDGTIDRVVTLALNNKSYSSNAAKFDQHFASVVPEGGKITPGDGPDGTKTWAISFTGKDAEAISAGTAKIFSTKAAKFTLADKLVEEGRLGVVRTITEQVDCSALCSEDVTVTDELFVAEAWSGQEQGGSQDKAPSGMKGYQLRMGEQGATLTLTRPLAFKVESIRTEIGTKQQVTQTITVQAPADTAKLAGEVLKKKLTPPSAVGSLATADKDGGTQYVITVKGDSDDAFNSAMASFMPGTKVEITEGTGNSWSKESYVVRVRNSFASLGYTAPVPHTVTVPSGRTIAEGIYAEGKESSITLENGTQTSPELQVMGRTTMATVVTIGGIVLGLLLAAGAALLVMRSMKRAKAAQAERASQPAGQQPSAQQFAAGQHPGAGQPVSQATPPPGWQPSSQATPPAPTWQQVNDPTQNLAQPGHQPTPPVHPQGPSDGPASGPPQG